MGKRGQFIRSSISSRGEEDLALYSVHGWGLTRS